MFQNFQLLCCCDFCHPFELENLLFTPAVKISVSVKVLDLDGKDAAR